MCRQQTMSGLAWLAILCLHMLSPVLLSLQAQDWNDERPRSVHLVLAETLKIPVQPVRGLAFGGRLPMLAALGDDAKVRVWNAATGELLKTIALTGRPKSVSCMAFSPDGKWIIAGEDFTNTGIFTGKIQLIDAAIGHEVRTLAAHHWEVESVAFSPDGRWLVSSNWDRKVRVIDFPSGNPARDFETASKPHCAAISSDGTTVAAGGEDSLVTVWDCESGRQLHRLQGHSGAVASVSFSPDGRRLASASADGSVRVWNVLTGQSLHTLSGHVGPVKAAEFSADGLFIVSGGLDRTVRVWNAATGQSLEALGANSSVWQLALSSDGQYVSAGYADGTIYVWKKHD